MHRSQRAFDFVPCRWLIFSPFNFFSLFSFFSYPAALTVHKFGHQSGRQQLPAPERAHPERGPLVASSLHVRL